MTNYGLTASASLFGVPSKKNKRQPVSKQQKNSVKIRQKGRCKDCHKVLVIEDYHHVKMVSRNGKSVTGNLVALCPECHRKRHIKEAAKRTDKKRTDKPQQNIWRFSPHVRYKF